MRQFDCEEVEYNVCSVPACVVSRNTLVSCSLLWQLYRIHHILISFT